MIVSDFTLVPSLAGGVLIGFASFIASAATGRIPGISGLLSRSMGGKPGDTVWRWVFLLGLVAGAGVAFIVSENAAAYEATTTRAGLVAAGLLVGFGTRIGGGCTSGHGVCGIGLGSKSGFVATLLFIGAGMATVFILKHVLGSAVAS